ncbi:MAG: Hsp33 family molecular chaperone HslO [Thiohalophilus sp.]|uniref:Hsp33 family molecular chaperone HslO n=1 Tax=Thiohalophilus sp. TaxID=3028392 RepID=UPI00286FFE38|nr:Hsp33 family molecular chaperone HslO [Thiohalophilus sp.]MDR9436274.1 Hsp33 family molecular chaperone HslO [Thiohalophilus sp.]
MSDTLQRFLFENLAIRGDLVQLDATWKALQEKHTYPDPVLHLLGEVMTASVLLSATLKHESRLTMQIQGNGAIPFMVVECTHDRNVRGMAHYAEDIQPGSLPDLVGDGRLAITLEPANSAERYQSIVELTGNNLAEAIDDYLSRSEQLDTRIWLAVTNQRTAGLLIQKLPANQTAEEQEGWNRVEQLSATITDKELLDLTAPQVIHRLYHEEDVRVFESEPICFRCPCSKDRVANMLRQLGNDEVRAILEDEEHIDVTCEFCNQRYRFDAVDAEQIFATEVTYRTPDTRH